MKSKHILVIILCLGFLVRYIQVESNPASLYWDEASIGYEAYSVSTTGKDMHGSSGIQAIFPAYGDYKAPVYIWLAAISIKLFGVSSMAIRLPSILFGTGVVGIMYLLAIELLSDKKIALAAATALAFLPGHIQFSRGGFEASVGLFFIALFLYLMHKGLQRKSAYIFAAISAVLAVYTYFSARIVIPLMTILFLIFHYKKSIKNFKAIGLGLTVFILGMIPLYTSSHFQAANTLRFSTDSILKNHDEVVYANQLREVDQNAIFSRILHHRNLYTLKKLTRNISDHFEVDYLFFSGDKNQRHSTGFSGIMLPTILVAFFAGLAQIFKTNKKTFYLLGLWVIFLLPASVPQETPHALRSLNAVISISLTVGIGLASIISFGRRNILAKTMTLIYLSTVALNFTTYYYHLQTQYPSESNTAWQDGYSQLGSYVKDQYKNYDHFIVTPGDRLYLYVLLSSEYSPEKIQAQQIKNLEENPRQFALSSFGKITFMPVVWSDLEKVTTSTLAIGDPSSFPEKVIIKDRIHDSNGKTIFVSVDMESQ